MVNSYAFMLKVGCNVTCLPIAFDISEKAYNPYALCIKGLRPATCILKIIVYLQLDSLLVGKI